MFVDEKAAGEAQTAEQKNRKLKLSEAIRLGAKLRPQGFGPCSQRAGDGTSCALQAAAEAVTGRLIKYTDDCRVALDIDSDLTVAIYKMNDGEKLTREEIADRLEAQGY